MVIPLDLLLSMLNSLGVFTTVPQALLISSIVFSILFTIRGATRLGAKTSFLIAVVVSYAINWFVFSEKSWMYYAFNSTEWLSGGTQFYIVLFVFMNIIFFFTITVAMAFKRWKKIDTYK